MPHRESGGLHVQGVLPRKLCLTLHHEKVRVARISRAQGYQRPLPDPLSSSRTWRMLLLDRRGRIHDRRIECTSDTLTAPILQCLKTGLSNSNCKWPSQVAAFTSGGPEPMVEYAIRVPSLEVQNLIRCSRTNPLLSAASQCESVLKASGKSQGFPSGKVVCNHFW